MSAPVYKMLELVGTSKTSYEEAIQTAITRASQTMSNLDWFEVKEFRGAVGADGKVSSYQAKIAIGFRLNDK